MRASYSKGERMEGSGMRGVGTSLNFIMCGNFFCTFCIYIKFCVYFVSEHSTAERALSRDEREGGGGFKRHENDNGPKGIFDAKQILYI